MAENQQNYGFEIVNPLSQRQDAQESPLNALFRKDDMVRVIKEYTEDKSLPDAEKTGFWGFHSKFMSLTFLDKEEILDIGMMRENAELIDIMSKPPQAYTWEKMQAFEQQKIFGLIQLNRSRGTTQGKINERTLQNTQISQMISNAVQQPASGSGGGIKGFFSNILR